MPSNPIDDFLQGIDPMDAATLFAGLRNSVPLGMAFRSGDLNAGEDAELAKRRGPATMPAPTPAEMDRREMMEFEARFPNPVLRELVIGEMLKQRRDPYSPSTATRRKDFEEAPESAQQSLSAAPKPKKFNKGGSAKKTLDQMAAELAQKSTKTADKPDLGRRSLFGLGSKPAFPLANIDTKTLEKMQSELKGAPTITEKTVTVDPGKGAAKSTLKSLAETPMSRREVLQSAAGQVMRGALPDLGGLSAMGNVAKAVESAVPKAASSFTNPLAIVMQMAKQGKSEQEIAQALSGMKLEGTHSFRDADDMLNIVRDPGNYLAGDLPTLKTPSGALREITGVGDKFMDDHVSPIKMRPELRQLRSADPEAYKDMVNAAKDISMLSAEEATNIGLKQKWIDKFMKGEISYDQLPEYYQRKIDNINAGFGSEY
jgi:hypothetical protein